MSKMKLFVASPDPQMAASILYDADRSLFSPVGTASNLMETYTSVEELAPDVVLIENTLVLLPEFEMLKSLITSMGIKWLGFGDADTATPNQRHVLNELAASLRKTCHNERSMSFVPEKFILIGASTGGVDALSNILAQFPSNCPPTVIVQHTGRQHGQGLSNLLDKVSPARVVGVAQPTPLRAGHVYVAISKDHHVTIAASGKPSLGIAKGQPVSGHTPSIDVLFRSAVPHARDATAVILTGMGRDGAEGITALRQAGATTIGQDATSSLVYGMPRVAFEMGGVGTQADLSNIANLALNSCAQAPKQALA